MKLRRSRPLQFCLLLLASELLSHFGINRLRGTGHAPTSRECSLVLGTKQVIYGCLLLGPLLLLCADYVAKTIVFPAELPIGIVTSGLGGPFLSIFCCDLRKRGLANDKRKEPSYKIGNKSILSNIDFELVLGPLMSFWDLMALENNTVATSRGGSTYTRRIDSLFWKIHCR